MKAAIFEGIRSIGLGERPDPVIKAPNDAISYNRLIIIYHETYLSTLDVVWDILMFYRQRRSLL